MHPDTHKKSAPCILWILAILAAGSVLWYLLFSFATAQKALAIEQDIGDRSAAALSTQSALVNVTAQSSGRDIELTGSVESEQARQQAEQIVLEVNGVRTVNNNIAVVEKLTRVTAPEYIPKSSAKVEPLPNEFPVLEQDKTDEQVDSIAAAQESIDQLDLNNIAFLHGSATLTEEANTTLDEVVRALNQHSDIRLRVEGHTDNTGDPNYNLDLSAQRAQSVVDYLVTQGIESTRLEASGFGDRKPIASNETKQGRSQNRRIEFKLINGEN